MKKKKIKPRSFPAIAARRRSGAGTHKDRKKEERKKRCRIKEVEND